ncbi:hypothetical protein AVEN_269218-1 [Araneus ventricosus]|uniref:Uncharacterized protein n=1 Tax=Araneus ventricosus TaxID=182803 RepID=A0A4Y2I2J5_ARAVE|nr:hypothetical protein AVEN_269218-1 [Araneus ventricosus]
MAITGLGPNPSRRGHVLSLEGGFNLPIAITPGEERPLLFIRRYLMHIYNGVTVNRVTPVLSRHPGTLNDSRCNSSRTEAGILQ